MSALWKEKKTGKKKAVKKIGKGKSSASPIVLDSDISLSDGQSGVRCAEQHEVLEGSKSGKCGPATDKLSHWSKPRPTIGKGGKLEWEFACCHCSS
jgi:hypothetical protein